MPVPLDEKHKFNDIIAVTSVRNFLQRNNPILYPHKKKSVCHKIHHRLRIQISQRQQSLNKETFTTRSQCLSRGRREVSENNVCVCVGGGHQPDCTLYSPSRPTSPLTRASNDAVKCQRAWSACVSARAFLRVCVTRAFIFLRRERVTVRRARSQAHGTPKLEKKTSPEESGR